MPLAVSNPEEVRLPEETEEKLAQLLDEYLLKLESGDRVAAEAILASAPEHAAQLRECAQSIEWLHSSRDPQQPHPLRLGDYSLIREVGRGGMGIVYEARQESLSRRIALKVLPFAAVLDAKQIERFYREAQAAARLEHPHIVPVYAVGCERGVHFYSMQFINGQSLDFLLHDLRSGIGAANIQSLQLEPSSDTLRDFKTVASTRNPRYFRSVANLIHQVAVALDYAHSQGIIHRDVKPSNVMVDAQGKPWITDFGLARCDASGSITASGSLVGTLRYMSPEQAAGKQALIDPRTDVYSLGATLYELLTLQPAFGETDRITLLRQIAHEEPPAPRRVNPAIPYDLETITLKAMAKLRDDRYESAADFAEDLENFLAGRPTRSHRIGRVERGLRYLLRHRGLALSVASGLVLLTVLAVVVSVLMASLRDQADNHLRTAHQLVERLGLETADRLAAIPQADSQRAELLAEAVRYYESFARYSQRNPAYRRERIQSLLRLGKLHSQLGDLAASSRVYELAQKELESWAGRNPQDVLWKENLAQLWNQRAELFTHLGESSAAIEAYQEGIRLVRELSFLDPANIEHQLTVAQSLLNLGEVYSMKGDIERARSSFADALTTLAAYRQRVPTEGRGIELQAAICNNRAELVETKPGERYSLLQEAVRLLRAPVSPNSNTMQWQYLLGVSEGNLAMAAYEIGEVDRSLAWFADADQTLSRLFEGTPSWLRHRLALAVLRNNWGQSLLRQNDLDGAAGKLDQAAQLLAEIPDGAMTPEVLSALASVLHNQSLLADRKGDQTLADEKMSRATSLQAEASRRAPSNARFLARLRQHRGGKQP